MTDLMEIVIIVKNGRIETVYSTEDAVVEIIDYDYSSPEDEEVLKEQLDMYQERIATGDEFYEVY